MFEDLGLLGCDSLSFGECFPTFEGTTVLQNVGKQSPNDTAPRFRRSESSNTAMIISNVTAIICVTPGVVSDKL